MQANASLPKDFVFLTDIDPAMIGIALFQTMK
jgi:hypothetical protein